MNLGQDSESDLLRFCGEVLEASQIETVGIQTDNKLSFENYIKSLLPKTRAITESRNSVRCAKERTSVQFYNKISN